MDEMHNVVVKHARATRKEQFAEFYSKAPPQLK